MLLHFESNASQVHYLQWSYSCSIIFAFIIIPFYRKPFFVVAFCSAEDSDSENSKTQISWFPGGLLPLLCWHSAHFLKNCVEESKKSEISHKSCVEEGKRFCCFTFFMYGFQRKIHRKASSSRRRAEDFLLGSSLSNLISA